MPVETEAGSAGEQPVRDSRLLTKIFWGFITMNGPNIFRSIYALKNSSINFF
jgi:hypothetical protein